MSQLGNDWGRTEDFAEFYTAECEELSMAKMR